MSTASSAEVHPLWSEFRDQLEESSFLDDAWERDRRQGAFIATIGGMLYLLGFWIDWGLEPSIGRWITAGRAAVFVAGLVVWWASGSQRRGPAWPRALLLFGFVGSFVIAAERLAWGGADPLPGGFVTIFIGIIVVLIGFIPLSMRSLAALGAFLIALPVGGLIVQGAPVATVFIGGQMLVGAVTGMLICSSLLQRERRRSWWTNRSLRSAHDHIAALLESNQETMEVLRQQAETDPLTGALNRRGGEVLAQALIARGEPVSVLVVDLDFFKRVNDTWGHAGGDQALCHVVHLMRSASRVGDLVIRWGGDELLLVLSDPHERAGREIGHRLATMARGTPVSHDSREFIVTLSVGCATGRGDLEPLLEAADQAVYTAKACGRDRAVHANELSDRLSA